MLSGLRALWMVSCFLLTVPAMAADRFAVVDAILVPTARGGWRSVHTDANARHVVPGGPTGGAPLTVGARLDEGDRLTTAMVRVRLRGDEQMVVGEGADVVLKERSVLQQLGEALCRVHGAFRVQFGMVEAAVEGTRFLVAESGVDLLAGRVRVTGRGSSVVAKPQQHVEVVDGVPQPPVSLTSQDDARVRGLQRRLAMSSNSLGVDLVGGYVGVGGAGTVRVMGRFAFASRGEVYVEGGVAFDEARFHVPLAAGLGWRMGWVRVAGGPEVRIGVCDVCTGGQVLEVLVGGQLQAGVMIPIAGRLGLSATLRGSVLKDRWTLDGGAGLAVGF